jgi:uncharacterized protein YjbI with pentapeptide repeats
MVKSPRIDEVPLPELEPGSLELLRPRAVVEGVSFENVEFSGLDLTDAVLTESLLDRVSIVESRLRGIRIAESRVEALNAPVLAAPLSQWRDTVVRLSRVGSAELFEAQFSGVSVEGCKLGYVNLRGATLDNSRFVDCTIDELDLGGVTARRVAITGCDIGTLDVTRASLADVDLRGSRFSTIVGLEGLRGATIDEGQLAELAPHLAAAAGLRVE